MSILRIQTELLDNGKGSYRSTPLPVFNRPIRQTHWLSLLLAFVFSFVLSPLSAGQANENVNVNVRSVVKVFVSKDKPAFLVRYQYGFQNQEKVYIKGLGIVPAHGEFEYLTQEPTLQIRTASRDETLAEVTLKETVIVASRAPLNLVPSINDFPASFRSDTWSSPTPLYERVNTVLRRYFSYMPYDDDRVSYIATTFTPLKVQELLPGATAQLALLISFPHDAVANKYSFRVHSLVHEGRILSDTTRPTSNQNIQRTASKFVDDLINEIRAGTRSQP